MKRVVHSLIGLVLLAILLGQGAVLIHMGLHESHWTACIDMVRQQRGWGALAGVGLLALVVVYLGTMFNRRPQGEQYLAFKHNGDTVSILLRAVSEFIAKIGDEYAAIVSMKPTLHPKGRSIDIDLDLRVKAGTQIPELCQLLQERVRESVRVNMGLADIKRISVHVKDIVGDPPPPDEIPDSDS